MNRSPSRPPAMRPSFPPTIRPPAPRERPSEVDVELRQLADRKAAEESASNLNSAPAPVPKPAATLTPPAESAVSMRLRERLAELRGAQRRARLRTIAIAGGAFAFVLLAVWIITFSPVFAFKIDDLKVNGTSTYVTKDDVTAVMTPHEGTPLLRLNTRAIAAELEENYAIKKAEFERTWPAGVTITLTPREAVAATPTEGGYQILDGEGRELAVVDEPVAGLPVIGLTEGDDLADSIESVLQVMDALPPSILEHVADVGARTPTDVHFTLDNGAQVIWGSVEEAALKAEVLELLLQTPANVYNVTTPLTPITS